MSYLCWNQLTPTLYYLALVLYIPTQLTRLNSPCNHKLNLTVYVSTVELSQQLSDVVKAQLESLKKQASPELVVAASAAGDLSTLRTFLQEHPEAVRSAHTLYMYMYRVSWVRVPPEAADFSQKKSLPQVSLNCVVFLCVCLEGVLKFIYHVT